MSRTVEYETKRVAPSEDATEPGPLREQALAAIRRAAQPQADAPPLHRRHVWQPDTWLIRSVWQTLADAGDAIPALAIAQQAAARDTLAPARALYRLADNAANSTTDSAGLEAALGRMQDRLFEEPAPNQAITRSEELLLAAATAARIDRPALACAFLERLDQIQGSWDHLFPHPEWRSLLAMVTARVGLHPLTVVLVQSSLRRFGEAGAQYLQQVTEQVAQANDSAPPHVARLLRRCVETVRYATLTTMHSHRVAIAILARAGLADEVMSHLNTLERVQDARRESGISLRKNDQSLLRQVKRPQADADVDFLVYTLQEAVRAMPVHAITREQRIELSRRLTTLGVQSDGWTAAGAAATLIELGAPKFAAEVVEQIAPGDPTRSEGAIALVEGLLSLEDNERAAAESEKALEWAREFGGENAVRATTWGLAEVYLDHGQPEKTLDLLATRTHATGFMHRLRTLFQPRWDDDDLGDNRLRLAARLRQNASGAEIDELVREMSQWAVRLLEGEARINYLIDEMIEPLLEAGRTDLVMELLPAAGDALAGGTGRHAEHVGRLAALLVPTITRGDLTGSDLLRVRTMLVRLWQADARRGLWQTVYGVSGSLPLLLALEGPGALADLARAAEDEGAQWVDGGQE